MGLLYCTAFTLGFFETEQMGESQLGLIQIPAVVQYLCPQQIPVILSYKQKKRVNVKYRGVGGGCMADKNITQRIFIVKIAENHSKDMAFE